MWKRRFPVWMGGKYKKVLVTREEIKEKGREGKTLFLFVRLPKVRKSKRIRSNNISIRV